MEARLFPHGERGGFDNKEDLRNWLDRDLRDRNGMYALARVYNVPSNSLALFEMEGAIIGCAVVREAAREMTEEERKWRDEHELEGDWRAVMWLDPSTIWVWRSQQDVYLREAEIRFLPGRPMTLTAQHILNVFRKVSERSR
jgi:hypothetical protein